MGYKEEYKLHDYIQEINILFKTYEFVILFVGMDIVFVNVIYKYYVHSYLVKLYFVIFINPSFK